MVSRRKESRKELMLRKQQKLFIHAGLPIGYVTMKIPLRRRGTGFLSFDKNKKKTGTEAKAEEGFKEFNETKEKMDPTRNPAVEEQAMMRIHWIGQKHTVSVRRFIVKLNKSNNRPVRIDDDQCRPCTWWSNIGGTRDGIDT
ncbi:hypothetical protein NC651_020953 [Populus alba x Populus x berolinensis]|nr:hypothetical protein NC651_020953 [Populus alba x Populus x berolinensis]